MISIFVSSTFNDMQAERDILHQNVLPALRNLALSYGETVRLVDLRWGVDTTDLQETEITSRVVRACLDSIDNCSNLIIVLLGTRYGWVPDDLPQSLLKKYGLEIDGPVSMTELEIRYGILNQKKNSKAVAFIRDSITNLPTELRSKYYDCNVRQNLLVQELHNCENCICRHYSLEYSSENEFNGLNEFASAVYGELSEIITSEFKKHPVSSASIDVMHSLFEAFTSEKRHGYLPVPILTKELMHFKESTDSIFVIEGPSGMGKSAFSAWISGRNSEIKVISFFCGLDFTCVYPSQILDYFIFSVCELLHLPYNVSPDTVADKRQLLTSLLYKTEKEIWLLVDAVNQLSVSQEEFLDWMPFSLPDNIRIIITTTPGNVPCQQLSLLWPVRYFQISQVYEKKKLLSHLFASENKDINYRLIDLIVEKKKIDSYLYAAMLVRSLTVLDRYDFSDINQHGGRMDDINDYLSEKILRMPDTAKDLGLFLIYELGEKILPDFAAAVLSLLAVSIAGVRATDLEILCPDLWNDIRFMEFTDFLHGFLITRQDGCINFTHSVLNDAVQIFATEETRNRYAGYISRLPDNDPLKMKTGILQMSRIGAVDEAVSFITKNSDSELVVNQIIEIYRSENSFLKRLLIYENILDWFLDKPLSRIRGYGHTGQLINMLRSLPANQTAMIKCKLYETIGDLYSLERKDEQAYNYYCLAYQADCGTDKKENTAIMLKMMKSRSVNSDLELQTMKSELNTLKKAMENGYLRSNEQKLIYWQCLLILCITDLPPVFLKSLFYVGGYRIKSIPNNAYVPFMLNYTQKMDDASLASRLYQIAKALCDEIYNCSDISNKLKFYDIFMLSIKLLEKSGRRSDVSILVGHVKKELTECIKQGYNNRLMFTIADIDFYLAVNENDLRIKKDLLTNCCSIWKRYIFDADNLPDFANKYAQALSLLSDIYLSQRDKPKFRDTILQERNVLYMITSAKVTYALELCRKYPDECNYKILEEDRSKLVQCQRTYVYRYYLQDTFPELTDISGRISLFHKMVYLIEEWPGKYRFTFPDPETYYRLKDIYKELSTKKTDENQAEIKLVKFQILASVYRTLNVYGNFISDESPYKLLHPMVFFSEKEMIIRELIHIVDGEILTIRLKYDLAETLFESAKISESHYEVYCNAALYILTEIMQQMDENELIPPTYEDEELSLYKMQFLYSRICYWTACKYMARNNTAKAVDFFHDALRWSLQTYGQIEDSAASDQLLLYIARSSCQKILENSRHCIDEKITNVQRVLDILNQMN